VASRIDTDRMVLRQLTAADLDWLVRLHGDRRVMRFIDEGEPVPRSVTAWQTLPAILREYAELPDGMGCYAATLRGSGQPLGWLALRPPFSIGLELQTPGTAELGYRLLPEAWGKGYAAEGARALLSRAFTELGLERVVATTMTLNVASRRVLERAGLTLLRTFLAQWPGYLDGAEHGDVVYAISRTSWLVGAAGPGPA
jgi:RimJ/RimL family protein N-acetyltransferase